MRQAGEASVEEILESIKKVISRDNRADAADERKQRETAGIQAVETSVDEELDDDGIFELSDHEELAEQSNQIDDLREAALVTEDVRNSMQESLAALAVLAEPGVRPQIVRTGETSLEGLTRELLRPALAQWLELNLPPLVERLVAAEIARIVGKKG